MKSTDVIFLSTVVGLGLWMLFCALTGPAKERVQNLAAACFAVLATGLLWYIAEHLAWIA